MPGIHLFCSWIMSLIVLGKIELISLPSKNDWTIEFKEPCFTYITSKTELFIQLYLSHIMYLKVQNNPKNVTQMYMPFCSLKQKANSLENLVTEIQVVPYQTFLLINRYHIDLFFLFIFNRLTSCQQQSEERYLLKMPLLRFLSCSSRHFSKC